MEVLACAHMVHIHCSNGGAVGHAAGGRALVHFRPVKLLDVGHQQLVLPVAVQQLVPGLVAFLDGVIDPLHCLCKAVHMSNLG